MIDTSKCTNAVIEIVQLTDDVIEAYCGNCKRSSVAHRQHYSKKTWAAMQADAKKHQNGGFKSE